MTASESTLRFPEWPLKYREVLLEADREKLSERVAEAEAAIFDRLKQIYGLKTDEPRAKEMGYLEIEALSNALLVYAPMQFLAGRQRPRGGNGDFCRLHAMNTSFPARPCHVYLDHGHSCRSRIPVALGEVLAYGAISAVSVSRMLARDHWASDMLVGSVLGFSIGRHIFYSRCDPELTEACRRHAQQKDQP
jgi:hypothetical protein